MDNDHSKPPSEGLIKRLFHSRKNTQTVELESTEMLLDLLYQAKESQLIDDDGLRIMSGAINMRDLSVEDVMITRDRMVCLDLDDEFSTWIDCIVESGHSRFPVCEGDLDNVLGILLAKDLLRYLRATHGQPTKESLRALIRTSPLVIPESKKIDKLLKDFKQTHTHIALVVDEFGVLKGLLTMEDILEELVGNIEDEYDTAEQEQVFQLEENKWRIDALMEIEEVNQHLGISLDNEECETLGGWIADELDHVPKKGDMIHFEQYVFSILDADDRRAIWVQVEKTT
ncbi:MAG: transporter associated domain-containing protein [Alcaligenaceae bacterium]|nr:transporter associated domain-containing protein [Alcaligenaceae bacterium]